MPHWTKHSSLRKYGVLGHELTWSYYRMRRHAKHPQRREVGDPTLPVNAVVEAMRYGKENQFQFWRDLRPPFEVLEARRLSHEPDAGKHPDGDLFALVYECGIDYGSERLWGGKSDAGTFNNTVHGEAKVRIPDGFPQKRPITIVSWGEPSLNWVAKEEKDEDGNAVPLAVIDPCKWMPISDELKQRADHPRFAACREATRNAKSKRGIEVTPLTKLLLGPHASLPRMARMQEERMEPEEKSGQHAKKVVRRRAHCIFTSAAGFVRYHG